MPKFVERALDLLELFAEQRRPLSLSDISRLMNIPVSSCHDVLQALQERGFIYEVSPRGGYYPTLRLYEAGKVIAENDPVMVRADNLLRDLRDALDESVVLLKVNGLQGIYLFFFETSHPLRFQLKAGAGVTSLHATSSGKAILGSLDDKALKTALARVKYEAFTPRTVQSKDDLLRQIRQGQEAGYYLNQGESMYGLTTISAPFRWQQSLYIVTISGPGSRFDSRLDDAAKKLLEVCRKLEMKSGL